MDHFFKRFYTQSYLKTGFTPMLPVHDTILPGDFFQVRNGNVHILGNIFRDRVVNPKDVVLEYDRHQNHKHWKVSDGVQEPYFGKKNFQSSYEGEEKDIKRFQFESTGGFFFSGRSPQSVKIKNWYDIEDQLVIKLTQAFYSFREVYVVSEAVSFSEWILAVANDHDAELELIIKIRDNGDADFFGHSEMKAVSAKHMACYLRADKSSVPLFKAKKLSARSQRDKMASLDAIRVENTRIDWTKEVFSFDFTLQEHHDTRFSQISLLDKLRGNELNPNTALSYFHWTDANLDDIEQLFGRP